MKVNDLSNLEAILRNVGSAEKVHGRVGVLESTNARMREVTSEERAKFKFASHGVREETPDENLTNADVGAKHEFGVREARIPERSFLRASLTPKWFGPVIEALPAEQLNVVASAKRSMDNICVAAVGLVDRAFEEGGLDPWAPLALETMLAKDSSKILIETSQLRQSITHDVR